MRVDWVTAGSCLGFLLLGGVAALSEVNLTQFILRAIVGALMGGLAGWGITRFFAIEVPAPSFTPAKSQNPSSEAEFVPIDLGNQAEVVGRDSEQL